MTATHRPPAILVSIAGVVTAGVLLAACGPGRPSSAADPATTGAPTLAVTISGATPPGVTAAPPAQAYVDAVNAGDLDALVAAFAPDGQVTDVTRPIRGRDAIRTWATNEVIGGRLEILSVTSQPGGQDLLVHWAPAGSSGWRAHYRFTMTDTQITRADLQYA